MRLELLLAALLPTAAFAQTTVSGDHVGMTAAAGVSPNPGGCEAPPPSGEDAVGCYLSASIDLGPQGEQTWWHIVQYADLAQATASKPPDAVVTTAFGRIWLQALGPQEWRPKGGTVVKIIGPLRLRSNVPFSARFIEATFTPGMRTRVHAHPGPEAFYVVDGAQCMDTSAGKSVAAAGEALIIPEGVSMQLSNSGPTMRRGLALVIGERGKPWMTMSDWKPTGACP